ncbi:hypothetical protein [Salinispira pacifica]|uniref:Uncharacterized protein n=1 Tax=Salinispira pacifica TaxID=1307761 RepID=V5WDF5_9SPIO|nr:hypothetical protein [Salinispira pacifica]AHC13635.1 hypothetical protein L21SP2_0191 [Salinispira pacifica]
MKACILICIHSLFLFSSPLIMAQEQQFKFINLPLQDDTHLEQGIEDLILEGYRPAGIDVLEGRFLSVLGQKEHADEGVNFALHFFSDLSKLNVEFSSYLKNGWTPADIAFFDEGVIVLFLQEDHDISSWRMAVLDGSNTADKQHNLVQLMEQMNEEGMLPFGLSYFDDQLLIGFSSPFRGKSDEILGHYVLDQYVNDGNQYVEEIQARLKAGFYISGLEVHDGEVLVGYSR